MRHLGPGGTGRQRRTARVGKEVQHLRTARIPGQRPALVVDEVPVGGLLGEDAHMLERREPQPHAQPHLPVSILHRPAVGSLGRKAPFAPFVAAGVTQERGVGRAPPLLLRKRPPPDGLRLGTARHITPEAFQFFEIARVDQFVIPEIGCQKLLHYFRFFVQSINDISQAAQSNSNR